MKLRTAAIAALAACAIACGQAGANKPFSAKERSIINDSDTVMYVTVMPKDSAVLRAVSTDLTHRQLRSPELRTLAAKMLATVQDPSQDGVGIAAPQVGINKRVICVQRFDKAGEPFEVYCNIHIDTLLGPVKSGREGCLSVPGKYGSVRRHQTAVIRYVEPETLVQRTDTIHDFTAVIFQHECDHLDGVLYIDKADSLWLSTE